VTVVQADVRQRSRLGADGGELHRIALSKKDQGNRWPLQNIVDRATGRRQIGDVGLSSRVIGAADVKAPATPHGGPALVGVIAVACAEIGQQSVTAVAGTPGRSAGGCPVARRT
jgi:hypothetical protein